MHQERKVGPGLDLQGRQCLPVVKERSEGSRSLSAKRQLLLSLIDKCICYASKLSLALCGERPRPQLPQVISGTFFFTSARMLKPSAGLQQAAACCSSVSFEQSWSPSRRLGGCSKMGGFCPEGSRADGYSLTCDAKSVGRCDSRPVLRCLYENGLARASW